MIYELRTYDLRPNTGPEAEERLADACAGAIADSLLVAAFHSEIGLLNQVLQIWRCADDKAHDLVLGMAAGVGDAIRDLVVEEHADAIVPFAVSPAIEPGAVGPFFEVRRYRFTVGMLPRIAAAWQAALPTRLALGPLVLVGSAASEQGSFETLLHIWPYASLDERWRLREAARATGLWPPTVAARALGLPPIAFLRQENAIVVPATFSPLQ